MAAASMVSTVWAMVSMAPVPAFAAPTDATAATTAAAPTLQQRSIAAQATAQGAAACTAIQPFYWEIGDAGRALASASLGPEAPSRDTVMPIASASKWVYAAYVAERRAGALTADDVRFLSFRSGYTRFRICRAAQTVAACADSLLNGFGRIDASAVDRFSYGGGHMQQHATLLGLGALDNDTLAAEIRRGLGPVGADWAFSYKQPQLAGGAASNTAGYAHFLQALMNGNLRLGKLLGTSAICANPRSCPNEALKSPIPDTETWHYSLGHWVEDDPALGDGAFSSAGAFGFYPWISRDQHFYGVLARADKQGLRSPKASERPGVQSVACGRLIRAAWADGKTRP